MKHLELHILQSVPVACLNRDDLNSPKTAIFGGVQRARVSSQSWKRAIREMSKEIAPLAFKGDRTRRMVFTLKNRLVTGKIEEPVAVTIAEQVADIVETLDTKTDADGFKKIKTLMFFSDAEYASISNVILKSEDVKTASGLLATALANHEEKAKDKALKAMSKILDKGTIAKAIKAVQLKDAADIALFGRMVANDHSLTVEGAALFSHALSTHKADNEIDFFAAVDDLQAKEDSGAGITSTLEFNSATYYRFAALNLKMLKDEEHLAVLTSEARGEVVKTFIQATLMAIPGARKNSMNANTLPGYVLAVIRDKGHPIQLINAFEKPIKSFSGKGLFELSKEALIKEYDNLKSRWNLNEKDKFIFPDDGGLTDLLDKVGPHVE